MSDLAALSGLFAAAFLAATLLPAQSEAVLMALVLQGDVATWVLVAVASAGNVLGALVNWVIGRGIERFRERAGSRSGLPRWRGCRAGIAGGAGGACSSPGPDRRRPAHGGGGAMREPLGTFLPLVAIGKVARYVILAAAVLRRRRDAASRWGRSPLALAGHEPPADDAVSPNRRYDGARAGRSGLARFTFDRITGSGASGRGRWPATKARRVASASRVSNGTLHGPRPRTEPLRCLGEFGGRDRDRTCDPLIKSQLLYQLSYAPILWPVAVPPSAVDGGCIVGGRVRPQGVFSKTGRGAFGLWKSLVGPAVWRGRQAALARGERSMRRA